ncbi:MAG: alpha-amylase family glycosyl hydrolase [Bacteroidota bacterium]
MRLRFPLTYVTVLIALWSCTEKERVAKWPYGVNYEVFVLSFADSNGDGKGDFKGLTAKLDYLQELGIGGIWLMPIMPSPTYHKYDVTNYKDVHPDYGTQEDFKRFVAEAHKRNIKVLVDLILNHTGYEHPWFQSAIKGKDSPYRDYYVWAKKDSIRNQIAKKAVSLDSDNITQWHPVNGDTLSEHYYGFFWGGMPDLNFDNPKVKQEFIEIGKFWLSDMNVDGFRLDAAKHIFPTERAADNHAIWVWFRKEMQKIKPDVYLVGEVWSKAEEVAPYLKGLPALFNFDLGYAITHLVQAGKDTTGFVENYKKIIDYYNASTSDYIDATFLKNHDQNRIMSELGDDESRARLAVSILMTLPGTPYVYYGEEIGMKGVKPDEYIREPFLWDVAGKDPMQTKWEEPRYSTEATVTPLAQQKSDPQSLYHFYKNWIGFRNGSRVLTYGSLELSPVKGGEIVSFYRVSEGEKWLVIHNVADVEITLPLPEGQSKVVFATHPEAVVKENGLALPARSTVIVAN